ncbi:MAG TPA: Spx/MgsR family RNA polymerase-binding regulatory protein [Thermoanaerobaculia bacterium]|jgi:Spx/MgsR family transcriptional regulator|nr:Spx/MgsR family RNA polymerase-binding regulatory protein [Thermoanaerobaculia bacterium]
MTKTLEVWLKPSCTSCRNAVADLEGRGFELVKHNLARDRPSRELLGRLIDELGLDAIISKRSPTYKARNLGERNLSKSEAIDLMLEDPNLMRRPLVLTSKGKAIFGYDVAQYEALK